MKKIYITAIACLFANNAFSQMQYEAVAKINTLYGYSDVSKEYESKTDNSQVTANSEVSLTARYDFESDFSTSFHLDLMAAADHELEDYNQGKWGEEVYNITSTPLGEFMIGQTFNVASQFHNGAPSAGPLGINNSDIVNFISNPNWKRNSDVTKFATLNTTYINTDGVAPKISYISPKIFGSTLGLTYIPDSYNKRGLINKDASYESKEGYVVAFYNESETGGISINTSTAYAYYNDNDAEFSGSMSLNRGGWTLGSGVRKTVSIGSKVSKHLSESKPDYYDGYRDGFAFDIGLKYEAGPIQTSLSYFMSRADKSDHQDQIIMLSNQYQYNQWIDIYGIVSHVNFEGDTNGIDDNNKGYAFVTGVGVNF